MLEPEGKILLLKTSPVHALTVGCGEVKLGVNWDSHPSGWACADRGVHVASIPAWLWTLSATTPTSQAGQASWLAILGI